MSMSPFPLPSLLSIVSKLFRVCQSPIGEPWDFITHFNPPVSSSWLSRAWVDDRSFWYRIFSLLDRDRIVSRRRQPQPRSFPISLLLVPLILFRPSCSSFTVISSSSILFFLVFVTRFAIMVVANLSSLNMKHALIPLAAPPSKDDEMLVTITEGIF
ncbi:hypothetical protein BGZ60DRAFT_416000 [Tricladium varicosporioides]|nr:hypothetical protein BGZ60DRAFT_416000 [Hymenoscyphus varicosporioides]